MEPSAASVTAVAFICMDSATNPFLNYPIGLYAITICYVALGVLAGSSKCDPARTLIPSHEAS